MRSKVDVKKHSPKLTHCAGRLLELFFDSFAEILPSATIDIGYSSVNGEKSELDLTCMSPSEQIHIHIESKPEGVELRFSEPGARGVASVLFFMHPLNFHRTCEAAVDFVAKIARGDIVIAREKKRSFPIFGAKRLRFFENGEIIGSADKVEKTLIWKKLNV